MCFCVMPLLGASVPAISEGQACQEGLRLVAQRLSVEPGQRPPWQGSACESG